MLTDEQREKSVEYKIQRARDVSEMIQSRGWKILEEKITGDIDKFSRIDKIEDKETNFLIIEIRRNQTRVAELKGILKTVTSWIKEGEVLIKNGGKNNG